MFTPRTPNARPAIEVGPAAYQRSYTGRIAPASVESTKPGDPEPMAPGDIPDVPPSAREKAGSRLVKDADSAREYPA